MQSHRYRFKRIINSIPRSSSPIRILDIGATPFTVFLKENYPHYEIFALDRTGLMEERCKEKGIQLKTCELDNDPIPFEDSYFDVVIFTEVLEHIFRPPTSVLKEVGRIMRHGGTLILSVPNIAALHNRIKLLFGVTPLESPDDQMKKDWVHGHGHIHEYTMKEITSRLESCNFRISNKTFLQQSASDVIEQSDKKRRIPRLIRWCLHAVIPQFKPTIYIECCKA